MNVLVFTSPSTHPPSVRATVSALKSILGNNYAVQTISHISLARDPWKASCALLVLPSRYPASSPPTPESDGIDVSSSASKAIRDFVENSGPNGPGVSSNGGPPNQGRVLILGAPNSSTRVGPPVSVFGIGSGLKRLALSSAFDSLGQTANSQDEDTPLRFYDRESGCSVSFDVPVGTPDADDGTHPESATARSTLTEGVDIYPVDDKQPVAIGIQLSSPSNIVGGIVVSEKARDVQILARIGSAQPTSPVAGLVLPINHGRLGIWTPRFENADPDSPAGEACLNLLRLTLSALGLTVSDPSTSSPPKPSPSTTSTSHPLPLPQFLTATPTKPYIVPRIIEAINEHPGKPLTVFRDANDEFRFSSLKDGVESLRAERQKAEEGWTDDPRIWQPKRIIVSHSLGQEGLALPEKHLTPLFDLRLYYEELVRARKRNGIKDTADESKWGVGEALLYGEVVTSTQTMLDKNPTLLSSLPTPLLSLASHQLAGRGRGSNIWLSPPGCLQFSLLLRVSQKQGSADYLPAQRIVFVQYLFALAVVEACRDGGVWAEDSEKVGERVRLKWPNDIYAVVGPGSNTDGELKKIGGILVNTSFSGGKIDLVVGCGLNVLNPPPITSLSQLSSSSSRTSALSMERTMACIMAKFEAMWETFLRNNGSFEPFMDLYLQRWLHSDQVVTLTTTTPHTKVRIVGITNDFGLLRTIPEGGGQGGGAGGYVDLQPDGNSFDLMANLIKAKS